MQEQAYALDISDWKQKGQELKDEIKHSIKSTQSVIVRSYPNRIIMTQSQYNDLTGHPELMSNKYAGQEFFLYRTPYNVMELEIKTT